MPGWKTAKPKNPKVRVPVLGSLFYFSLFVLSSDGDTIRYSTINSICISPLS